MTTNQKALAAARIANLGEGRPKKTVSADTVNAEPISQTEAGARIANVERGGRRTLNASAAALNAEPISKQKLAPRS